MHMRVYEVSSPVTIPLVDSIGHEFSLSSTFYLFSPWNQCLATDIPYHDASGRGHVSVCAT